MSSPLARLLHARGAKRLLVTVSAASLLYAFLALNWDSSLAGLAPFVYVPAAVALFMFSLLERWPRRLPEFAPRWAMQVIGATVAPPITVLVFFLSTIKPGSPPFWDVREQWTGFLVLCVFGTLLGSWISMGALVRERDALVTQAERRRGELERQALDGKLRLLQAQVEPHFLFNTLANVQALVDAKSDHASPVLASLIAYLRVAVPRISEPVSRLGQEIEMADAYLALMRLRLPDRLQYQVDCDPALRAIRCPPMTLLTLVENAVCHGIDPSLDGGRIHVRVLGLPSGRCIASVEDTGVGMQAHSQGLGTGLSSLRERLRLAFGDAAQLRLSEIQPHGVLAEIEFPAYA